MRKAIDEVRKTATIENAVKAVKNPKLILEFIRYITPNKKDRMDMDAERRETPKRLASVLPVSDDDIEKYLDEIQNDRGFYQHFNNKKKDLVEAEVYSQTTSVFDSRTLYSVCRAMEPDTVVVTGARYGSFDAHIAAALAKNGHGTIYSIDLPDALEAYDFGYLIEEDHKHRWNLKLGDSKDILPDILNDIGSVDLFLHDSLHTKDHMKWEYETVYPYISENGILSSHDIMKNEEFQDFSTKKNMDWTTIRDLGIAKKSF